MVRIEPTEAYYYQANLRTRTLKKKLCVFNITTP